MLKTSRNTAIDLRKKRNYINLEEINMVSCITIAMIVLIFILSVAVFASFPNSNMPAGI
jgi:biopolymer transport protein ExbD